MGNCIYRKLVFLTKNVTTISKVACNKSRKIEVTTVKLKAFVEGDIYYLRQDIQYLLISREQ